MHEKHIPVISDSLSRLIRGEEVGKEELKTITNHIVSCPQCMTELLVTLQLVKGELLLPETWANSGLSCLMCQEYLPLYVEERETNAREKYPWIASHLSNCAECKESFETLRYLVGSQKELGSLPVINAQSINSPLSDQAPVSRFGRMLKVFWENRKSIVSELPAKKLSNVLNSGLSSFQTRVISPAYLAPDDIEAQELTCSFPEGLKLILNIIPSNQQFTLIVTPVFSNPKRIRISLFQTEDSGVFLMADAERDDGQQCLFGGLVKGVYEIHVETVVNGQKKGWEVPLELG